jgi:hypothetical protein
LETSVPAVLLAYHRRGGPLSLELDCQPFACEFWPVALLGTYNAEYRVSRYAPGYFGFGTNGGGEMFAIAPDGRIVCVPFIGMSPEAELYVAASWADFEQILGRSRR